MSTPKEIMQHARKLRRESTFEENLFWQKVRNRRLNGLKFNRQFPIIYTTTFPFKYFVADFYCHEKKIIIELDGPIHLTRKEYDSNRDRIISELGIRVLRIKNEEVKDWLDLKKKIIDFLEFTNLP